MTDTAYAGSMPKLHDVVADVPFEAGPKSAEPTRPYWVILDQNCPLPNVAFGGVTFHKKTEKGGADGTTVTIPGQLLWLTDRTIELVRQELQTRVLRLYYVVDDMGRRSIRGQQDVGHSRWDRPGVDARGVPFVGTDGKPLEKAVMVRLPSYQPSVNDHPFTKWVKLQRVTDDLLPYIQAVMGLEVTKAFLDESLNPLAMSGNPLAALVGAHDPVAEAKAFNAEQADKEQTLAAEAGVSRRRRGPSGSMIRED